MARAREYLKRKTKTKINMAARLLSRVALHLPLSVLSRTSVYQKTPRNVLKNTLLSSSPDVVKLRSQFAVLIAPTSEREDGRDRTRRKLQSGHGALFMVGGFALSSLGDETPKTAGVSAEVQLIREKQPPLRDEKGRFSRKKPTRSGNTDDRTRGIQEWRAKRKLEFQGMVEDWSPPKKRETRLSQVWFKSCFRCMWHQAIHLKVLRQVLHQDFLCSEIVLNLDFYIIPQVVHSKLSRQHDYT